MAGYNYDKSGRNPGDIRRRRGPPKPIAKAVTKNPRVTKKATRKKSSPVMAGSRSEADIARRRAAPRSGQVKTQPVMAGKVDRSKPATTVRKAVSTTTVREKPKTPNPKGAGSRGAQALKWPYNFNREANRLLKKQQDAEAAAKKRKEAYLKMKAGEEAVLKRIREQQAEIKRQRAAQNPRGRGRGR